jgi:hypothetical protein
MRHYYLQDMANAYLDAAEFTDAEQAGEDQVFSTKFKEEAYEACLNFENACATLEIDLRQYPAHQVGHDLWLTRNEHGAGFWDSTKIYGKNADIFTGIARAQGFHDVEFV